MAIVPARSKGRMYLKSILAKQLSGRRWQIGSTATVRYGGIFAMWMRMIATDVWM